ncbi:MAG: RDD family protein [Actinobacteria bacterium]|nr:RDD family protein [Actinomycetota bacterium]
MNPPASVGLRAAARIADVVLVMVPAWLLIAPIVLVVIDDAAGATLLTGLIAWAVVIAYETRFTTVTGQTIGKRATGLRVVARGGDEPPTPRAALVRAAVPPLLGTATFFAYGVGWLVPYAWALVARDRRGLHDLLAGTEVVAVTSE